MPFGAWPLKSRPSISAEAISAALTTAPDSSPPSTSTWSPALPGLLPVPSG